jgi:hypothetical protein
MVAVGFGEAGSLNGPVLTLAAERQGGVYLQNPNGPADDLKHFFVKAFGTVSGEIVMLDPEGILPAGAPATQVIEHRACADTTLTFATGWDETVTPGELRLLVTSPAGDLVLPNVPRVEASDERLWSHVRVPMPYRGATSGTWQAQLIRPHQVIVNGFAPTAFEDAKAGAALVRRQIQRLCPDGCERVLHYEHGFTGDSSYTIALEQEAEAGLLGHLERVDDPAGLADLLSAGEWDLLVFAHGGDDIKHPFDEPLARLLCARQRAVLSDNRPTASAIALRCAGARRAGNAEWKVIDPEAAFALKPLQLRDPGNSKESWVLAALNPQAGLATGLPGGGDAAAARTRNGPELRWFLDVLGRGLSKVQPVSMQRRWRTGDRILVAARVPPSYNRAGGYDNVDARVIVTYPTVGLGTLTAERRPDDRRFEGETVSGPAATLDAIQVPTRTIELKLNDDGVDGDQIPGNGHWTGALDGVPIVDGHYELRFVFDFTADGCTSRREASQSLFVEVGVDPDSTKIDVRPGTLRPDGSRRLDLQLTPMDRFGNLLGTGRLGLPSCQPSEACRLDVQGARDLGDGSYAVAVDVAPAVGAVRLTAFDQAFDVAVPCERCPRVTSLELDLARAEEHATVDGYVMLEGPAPENAFGGALVFLNSSNQHLADVPASVVVPAGETGVGFTIEIRHLLSGEGERVRLEARYAGSTAEAAVTVWPEQHGDEPARSVAGPPPGVEFHYPGMRHR